MRHRRRLFISVLLAALSLPLAAPAGAAGPTDWSGYLFAPSHSSFSAGATTIMTGNAAALRRYWQWKPAGPTITGQPNAHLWSSPTVVAGRVYLGADTGVFYALDIATKKVLWSRFFGFVKKTTCGAYGFVSTATVAPDPTRGGQLTVYVAAADGYLYALRASDGAQVWRAVVGIPSSTQNDYFNWSSPTVSGGKVYMGVASECDNPLVRGGAKGYDQASGALLGTYFAVPTKGGGVWSSIAVGPTGDAFVTTGNAPTGTDGQSVVRVNGTSMAREDAWRIPASQATGDADFGASPTLFTETLNGMAVPMVGACNKNGRYYALRQQNLAAGPVWQLQASIATPAGQRACLTAAIWDGSRLFLAAAATSIGGTAYAGSIRRLDPSTGAVLWARGLSGTILGSPTLDGSGVIAAGTYMPNGANRIYLINSATGAVLATISTGTGAIYGQPVFADGYLLVPTVTQGLLIYGP